MPSCLLKCVPCPKVRTRTAFLRTYKAKWPLIQIRVGAKALILFFISFSPLVSYNLPFGVAQ